MGQFLVFLYIRYELCAENMNLLYINDLRALPNFGCRSTGAALEEMLKKKHNVLRRDGIETIYGSGWDLLSPGYYRIGGVIPDKYYKHFWRRRNTYPNLYRLICSIDKSAGGIFDYIVEDAAHSLQRFQNFKVKYAHLSELEMQVCETDGVVINGEGTLIFANPTRRDALYLLFIIALARSKNKPVFLLNAMITVCPYTGTDSSVLQQAAELLSYCSIIACREQQSYDFVASQLGCSSSRLIPDALFTWGDKFRYAASAVRKLPELVLAYGSKLSPSDLDFNEPYVCVSSSSSVWRNAKAASVSFVGLAKALQAAGLRVYFISTCTGDNLLESAARGAGVTHISQNIPVLAGAGVIAGAAVYITGRYHPAIMAGAGGVPTVFMSSNSHKTRSVQTLLGYDVPTEFSVAPSADEISLIVSMTSDMIYKRSAYENRIRSSFDIQAARARAYESVLDEIG